MTTKRIYNPVTGKHYPVRNRSSKAGSKGRIRGLWQKKSILLLILLFTCCLAPVAAATPLTPDGGTGYTVSGSIASGNISYTITAAGEYELTDDLVTTAENAITIPAGGNRIIAINGNNHTVGGNTTSLTATTNGGTTLTLHLNDITLNKNVTITGAAGAAGGTGRTGYASTTSGDKGGTGGVGGTGGSVITIMSNLYCTGIIDISSGTGGNGGQGGRGGSPSNEGTYNTPVSPGQGGNGGTGGTGGTLSVTFDRAHCNIVKLSSGSGGAGGTGGGDGGHRGYFYIPDGSYGGTGGTGGLLSLSQKNMSDTDIENLIIDLPKGGIGGYGLSAGQNYDGQRGGHGGNGGSAGSYTRIFENATITDTLIISAPTDGGAGGSAGGSFGGTGPTYGGVGGKGTLVNCKIENSKISIPTGDAIQLTTFIAQESPISLISNVFNVPNGYIINATLSAAPTTQTLVYNNYFNAVNYFSDTRGYKFYIDPVPGINIMGGSVVGGNYWTNPTGTGYSDNPQSTILGSFTLEPYNGDICPLVKDPNQPTQTPNSISTEPSEIITTDTDRYTAIQQYIIPTNLVEISYIDTKNAILATGNSIYNLISDTQTVTSVTTNTGSTITSAYLSTNSAAAINTQNAVTIYPYTGPTATTIFQSTTAPTSVSQTSQLTSYTAPINSNTYLIIHNTTTGAYIAHTQTTDTHLSANNNTNLILGHSGTQTLNIYRINDTTIQQTTQTIPSPITEIKEISGTDSIIITTTAKTYIYTLTTDGTATLLMASAETASLIHPRGTITNNIIATYQNNLYIIDQSGVTIGTYAAGANLNAVDISRRSGLWAVAGGIDNQIYFLTKSSTSGWYLEQTTLAMDTITHAAMGTTGYYALVATGTTLSLFTLGNAIDPEQTVTYWLNGIVIGTNGAPYVGPITVSGTAVTTDATGKFVMKVTPGTTYTITAAGTTTQYTATNVQYQTVAIKIQPDPYATNIDYSASWNNTAQAIQMSYTDKTGRTDSVTWRIRNTATNDIVYQQSAPSDQVISYSVPAEQQYTNYQVSMSADRTNAAGTETQVSNTWMITPSGSSPLALPLDDTGKNILFTGVLMMFAALFGVMHSTKGAIAITALAAMMRYLELVTIPWVVIIIAMAIAILAALAKGGGGK